MEEFSIIDKPESYSLPPFSDNNDSQDSFQSIFADSVIKDYEIVSQSPINTSSGFSSKTNSNNLGIWNTIKKNISNAKNILTFNLFSNTSKLDLGAQKEIKIFNKSFKPSSFEDNASLVKLLENIIWFSYRSDFDEIIYNNVCYTSDAGWGCILRAGQMILAQGISSIFKLNTLDEFMKEKIYLFLDKEIPVSTVKMTFESPLFYNQDAFEKVEPKVKPDFSILYMLIAKKPKDIKKITPPFSIRNICQMNPSLSKGAGVWFSNYDIVKIIKEINVKTSALDVDNKVSIINFDDGVFYLDEIIKECFEQVEFNSIENTYEDSSCIEKSIVDNHSIFLNGCIDVDTQKKTVRCPDNMFEYNARLYRLVKKCIIFISVRHGGLQNIEEGMEDAVLKFFEFENNIGILGGKKSRALYFIGKCDRDLIFLDPHYVQKAVDVNEILYGDGIQTFKPQNIYHINVSEMSPIFTLGLVCRNTNEFTVMIQKIEKMIKTSKENPLFEFKIERAQENVISYDNLMSFEI